MEAKNDGKMERLYPSSFKYDTILRYLCYIEGGLQIAHVGEESNNQQMYGNLQWFVLLTMYGLRVGFVYFMTRLFFRWKWQPQPPNVTSPSPYQLLQK